MPWAFSPKDLLAPKNQNIAKLWKTSINDCASHLGFVVNDRSPMTLSTLRELLCATKANAVPVEVTLPGDHQKNLFIRAVGDSWFSAHDTRRSGSEVVISLGALQMFSTEMGEPQPPVSVHPGVPLSAMMVQLERQKTTIILHLSGITLRGVMCSVGQDYLGVTVAGDRRVMVPFENFLWLEACG